MLKELELDTRELEAPEPIDMVMNALSQLDNSTYIKMIHRMEPKMLYINLDKNNLHYKARIQNETVYIYIWNDTFEKLSLLEDILCL